MAKRYRAWVPVTGFSRWLPPRLKSTAFEALTISGECCDSKSASSFHRFAQLLLNFNYSDLSVAYRWFTWYIYI